MYFLVKTDSLLQSVAFRISLVVIPTLAAADVAVLLTECALNMSVLLQYSPDPSGSGL